MRPNCRHKSSPGGISRSVAHSALHAESDFSQRIPSRRFLSELKCLAFVCQPLEPDHLSVYWCATVYPAQYRREQERLESERERALEKEKPLTLAKGKHYVERTRRLRKILGCDACHCHVFSIIEDRSEERRLPDRK